MNIKKWNKLLLKKITFVTFDIQQHDNECGTAWQFNWEVFSFGFLSSKKKKNKVKKWIKNVN